MARTAVALITGTLAFYAGPAMAKVCKDPLTVTSSSRIAGTDERRDARARDNAINRWSKQSQATHGLAYKFWFRSDDQKVDCMRTKSTSRCTATAKPCRIL